MQNNGSFLGSLAPSILNRGKLEPILYALIFVAYFLPWISHPTAGLTLIGLDVSEWVKFMPQMQSGELPNRDYFYLPLIALGLCIALFSLERETEKILWVWIVRVLAVSVGFITFPSLDAFRFENQSEWQLRVLWIALLIMGFEEEFGAEISDEEAQQITTVGQAVRYIDSRS